MDGGAEAGREDSADHTPRPRRIGRGVYPRDAIQQIGHDRHDMYFLTSPEEEAQ